MPLFVLRVIPHSNNMFLRPKKFQFTLIHRLFLFFYSFAYVTVVVTNARSSCQFRWISIYSTCFSTFHHHTLGLHLHGDQFPSPPSASPPHFCPPTHYFRPAFTLAVGATVPLQFYTCMKSVRCFFGSSLKDYTYLLRLVYSWCTFIN